MEDEISKSFLKTELFTDFGRFFVSTIYRRSSDIYGGWYYETFGWTFAEDSSDAKRHIIADNSGANYPEKALQQHTEVCRQLIKTGTFKLEEES